jgi:membrane protein implicated in regulation of membrane protease activity
MATVAVSFIGYVVKVVIFAAIAFAGIMCGKKLRDKNDAKKAAQSQESIR